MAPHVRGLMEKEKESRHGKDKNEQKYDVASIVEGTIWAGGTAFAEGTSDKVHEKGKNKRSYIRKSARAKPKIRKKRVRKEKGEINHA